MVSLPLCLLFYSRGIYYYCNVTKGALPPSICLPIFSCGKWYVLPLAFVMLLLDATEPSWGEHKHVRDCACIHFLLWASRCMECVPHRRVHLLQGTGACLRGLLCHMRTCGGVRVRVWRRDRTRRWVQLMPCSDHRAVSPYIHTLPLYLCSWFIRQLVPMPPCWPQMVSLYTGNSHVFIKFQQILPKAIVLVALTGTCLPILYLQEKFITYRHIS